MKKLKEQWIIVRPGETRQRCPKCGQSSVCVPQEQYGMWMPKAKWECPFCLSLSTTENINFGVLDYDH